MAARTSQEHPLPSQELDARFLVFLKPIHDLTKNWEVDIAKYLEEYLEKLAHLRQSLGGVASINFIEAALLIQGSTAIYSKKVDYLRQMVQKMVDLLSSRYDVQAGADCLGGGGEGGSGGRTSRLNISHSFSCLDSVEISNTIYLENDKDSMGKNLKLLPSIPFNLIGMEAEKSQNHFNLLGRNNEVLGTKNDFWLTSSSLAPMGMPHFKVPGELQAGTSGDVSCMLGDEEGIQHDILEIEIHPPPEDAGEDSSLEENPSPSADPPPPPQIEDPNSEHSDNASESYIDVNKQRYGLRKRNKDNKEMLATLEQTDKLEPMDPSADCPLERLPRAGRLRVPTPCPCHRPSKRKKKTNLARENIISVEELLTSQLNMLKKIRRYRANLLPLEILENAAEEEENRINKVKINSVRRFTEEGLSREEILQAAKEAEQEARQPLQTEDDHDYPLGNVSGVGLDLDDPYFVLPEAHPEDQHIAEAAVMPGLSDFVTSEMPSSQYETLVLKWVEDYVNSVQERIKLSDIQKRVEEWRKMAMPKLEAEEARTAFDIHHYCSLILNRFPKDHQKPTIPFKQLMVGTDDPREVTRYFLSCLMLANNYNIEICKTNSDDLANGSLKLTLKSRARPPEELGEYTTQTSVGASVL